MKAAVFHRPGEKLSIQDIPDPVAGEGEVVLKVEACGVCGSDLHATTEGVFLQEPGTVLGHEFSGDVVESGDPSIPVGMRATAVPVNACGHCSHCRDGFPMMCAQNQITGFTDIRGAYAQFVKVRSRYVVPLRDEVSYEEGATIEPLAVGLHAVTKAGVQIGDRVLVIGAGPIGLATTTFARLAGAGAVIVSERASARLIAARRFGATGVVDAATANDVGEAFADLAGGDPTVIFDCVGVPGVIQSCVDLSAPRGTIVVVGVCMQKDTQIPMNSIFKELQVKYILGYRETDFARVLAAVHTGGVKGTQMITDRVTLSQLPDAFEGLRKPDTQIKVMIRPNA